MDNELFNQINESEICDDIKALFASNRKKALFGAGAQARLCRDLLMQCGLSIDFLLVEKSATRYPILPGEEELPMYFVKDADDDKKEYDILVAVNEKYNDEIRAILKENGFNHVYCADEWEKTNWDLRVITFNHYIYNYTGKDYSNAPVLEYKNFRIVNYWKQPMEYSTMLIGEFNDIIAPSIFNDYSCMTEGAYELDKVVLEQGDVVFDLGANIGMFSCVAASKGCDVYSFEPTPHTASLLEMNAKLYDNFHVCQYAVCDKTGITEFYINPLDGDYNSGMNSITHRSEITQKTHVKAISIDDFVEENNLVSVDFIKADIEGAERDMLVGARKTLEKFAPKLSLCTYHLPGDPEVMEQLILEINPNYVIEHRWKKLYAYVPNK